MNPPIAFFVFFVIKRLNRRDLIAIREVQRSTEGRSTGPNRDRRSQKMDRTGLGPNSVRSGSGLRSWTEGQNPKIQKSNYPIPKSKIRKSKLSKIQAFAESRFPIFRLPPSSGFRHLPASAISIIIENPGIFRLPPSPSSSLNLYRLQ